MPRVREIWTPKNDVEAISEEARALYPRMEELRELDDGSTMGYYLRGHIDLALFLDAVDWAFEFGCDPRPGAQVKHTWWRSVPIAPSRDMFCTRQFIEAPGPGRGAFAVTVVDW